MTSGVVRLGIGVVVAAALLIGVRKMAIGAETRKEPIPAPVVDEQGTAHGQETAVLAGGCFWGVQSVYNRVKGVKHTVAGYSGGTKESANYEAVSSEQTGHAESLKVVFDPTVV